MRPVESKEPFSSTQENYHSTTFLLVIQNKDVNGNRQLSREHALPFTVSEVPHVAEQAPSVKWTSITAMKARAECSETWELSFPTWFALQDLELLDLQDFASTPRLGM